jgi:membrane protein YdbS with pleckstrin-like domain
MWAVDGLVGAGMLAGLAVVARLVVPDGAGGVPAWLLDAVVVLAVLDVAFAVLVLPRLRWRRWRYEVRDEEVDLLRGRFAITRTLVPIARIQHVETERTALSRAFGLATVRFFTAAGSTTIPALTEADAAAIRDRVARLARVPDEL